MPRSRFTRFKDGVQISGVALQVAHSGITLYVGNSSAVQPQGIGASDGNDGKTPERPLSTIDAAINLCTAGRGDTIFVMPGHVEAVTATSIVMDTAGVRIIGLGNGANRPILTFGVTSSNIAITGANTVMRNMILKSTVDSVVAGITVSAAGVDLDLESQDTSSTVEFVSVIVADTSGDNLKVKLRHRGFAAGDAMTRCIDLVGVIDAEIDVDFFGIASTAVVNMRTTACANVRVTGTFYNDSVALTKNVVNSTTATWSVRGFDAKGANEFAGSDDTAVAYMPTSASSAFLPGLGYRVTKTSAMADGSGTDNLFTVTGRCLITHLSGEVTTQIGTTTTMKLSDVTNTVDLCAATTITSDVVGTMYALPGLSAQILNGTGGTPVVGSIPNMTTPSSGAGQIIGDSQAALTVAHVLDGAGTGAVAWVLYYMPLTDASTIVAAA